MIRKLKKEDHEQLMEFLKDEQSINLFMIGDIEAFGYDEEFQEMWAQFDDNNEIIAVLLRFYHGYIPYANGEFDINAFVEIIQRDEQFSEFSGKASITEKFESTALKLGRKQSTYFAEMKDDKDLPKELPLSIVKRATIDDVDRIIEARAKISEFKQFPDAREKLMKVFESNIGRTFYIEQDGEMIAVASTTAENSLSAMVVGVATLPEYRGKGYASILVAALSQQLLKEGKTLCLFYDNPAAGKIYKRLGYKDIGLWNMYR